MTTQRELPTDLTTETLVDYVIDGLTSALPDIPGLRDTLTPIAATVAEDTDLDAAVEEYAAGVDWPVGDEDRRDVRTSLAVNVAIYVWNRTMVEQRPALSAQQRASLARVYARHMAALAVLESSLG